MLLADDFDRHVQDLSDLLDGACPAALRCSEVMCGAALAPAVVPFACAYGEARAEGGVTVLQSGAILDDAFTYDELEMSVSILRDGQVGDRAWLRIEAREETTAGFAVEHWNDFHRGLACRGRSRRHLSRSGR